MIYLVIGGSHAGKTSFVFNSFVKGRNNKEYKDILTICENDDYILIGKYLIDERTKGTDRISRKDIPKFFDQVKKLYSKGKDIILEGDKIVSEKFFSSLLNEGYEVKLFYIKCNPETSIKRNRAAGSTSSDSHLKSVCTKSENLFNKFCINFDGEIINTDNIKDFSKLSIDTIKRKQPKERKAIIRDDFAVFILTHGRPDNVITYKTLQKLNYKGKIYFIVDNEDKTVDKYKENFGQDNVIVFDKLDISRRYETFDNFDERKTIFYARNASFEIAKKLGLKYFVQFDDDYTSFRFRYQVGNSDVLSSVKVKQIERVFNCFIDFLENNKNVSTIAFAQGGDYIGGTGSNVWKYQLSRKAMNSFFCSVERPFQFVGRINEDVNTYTLLGSQGKLFFTECSFMLNQMITQGNEGGMTDVYLLSGTYVKSFYSVICMPSAVKIAMMGMKDKRIHHKIYWDKCTPKILSPKYKKGVLL